MVALPTLSLVNVSLTNLLSVGIIVLFSINFVIFDNAEDELINFLVISSLGLAKISYTSPSSTTLPFSITATRFAIDLITLISCVIKIIVIPNLLFKSLNNFKMDSVASGSKAEVASSESNTLGLFDKALAMATRCFCPPDNCDGYTYFLSAKSTRSNNSSTRVSISFFDNPVYFNGYATLSNTVLRSNKLKC